MLLYPFNDEGMALVEQLNAERKSEINSLMYEVQSLARELGPKAWALFLDMTSAGDAHYEALTAKVDEASEDQTAEGFAAFQAHSYARHTLEVAQCEQQLAALQALSWGEE